MRIAAAISPPQRHDKATDCTLLKSTRVRIQVSRLRRRFPRGPCWISWFSYGLECKDPYHTEIPRCSRCCSPFVRPGDRHWQLIPGNDMPNAEPSTSQHPHRVLCMPESISNLWSRSVRARERYCILAH